jgi:hypothetical protein
MINIRQVSQVAFLHMLNSNWLELYLEVLSVSKVFTLDYTAEAYEPQERVCFCVLEKFGIEKMMWVFIESCRRQPSSVTLINGPRYTWSIERFQSVMH